MVVHGYMLGLPTVHLKNHNLFKKGMLELPLKGGYFNGASVLLIGSSSDLAAIDNNFEIYFFYYYYYYLYSSILLMIYCVTKTVL